MDTAQQPSVQEPLQRPQTEDELKFYAPNFPWLSIFSVICFPPFGLFSVYFSYRTKQANRNSHWEDAYRNSSRTIWFAMLAIVALFGIIYGMALYK